MLKNEEIPELVKKEPWIFVALCLTGLTLLGRAPTKERPDVPGLQERRNAAWRGRGSFGKAPFGPQTRGRRG